MDQKGYVISGLSFLLTIPAIYIVITFIGMTITGSQSQELLIQSDIVLSVKRDIESNIPLIAEDTFQTASKDVVKNGYPLQNSETTIKNRLQNKIDEITIKYSNERINASCKIISVHPSKDPFKVNIKSIISINKDHGIHKINLSQYIPIIDPNCPIPDPLPFIKCKNFGGVKYTKTRIVYESSLRNYLKNEKMHNANAYINATSPLIFKKCPNNPYKIHGQSYEFTNLRNCIENGFYHESNDGSCFLCRLEGKGVCSHTGLETFIIPQVTEDQGYLRAPCSSDHVIFNDNYEGFGLIYHSNSSGHYKIFLDHDHRLKYGLT